MSKIKFFNIIFFFISICFVEAKIKLPTLVSDGIILQRDQKLKIWGQADIGEKVEVNFQHK